MKKYLPAFAFALMFASPAEARCGGATGDCHYKYANVAQSDAERADSLALDLENATQKLDKAEDKLITLRVNLVVSVLLNTIALVSALSRQYYDPFKTRNNL